MASKGKGKARKRHRTPPPNPELFDDDDGDVVVSGPLRPAQPSHPSTSRLEGEEGGARATPRASSARAGGGTHVTPPTSRLNNEAQASLSTSRRDRESTYQVDVRPNEPYRHTSGLPYGEEVEMETSRTPTPELRPRRERRVDRRGDNSPPHRRAYEHDSGSNEPWEFNPITRLVCPDRCSICASYTKHYLDTATYPDRSFRLATGKQYDAQTASIQNELLQADLELERLRSELEHYRKRCLEAEARLDQLDEGRRKCPRLSEESSASRDAVR